MRETFSKTNFSPILFDGSAFRSLQIGQNAFLHPQKEVPKVTMTTPSYPLPKTKATFLAKLMKGIAKQSHILQLLGSFC